jgi:hypothetical protein
VGIACADRTESIVVGASSDRQMPAAILRARSSAFAASIPPLRYQAAIAPGFASSHRLGVRSLAAMAAACERGQRSGR